MHVSLQTFAGFVAGVVAHPSDADSVQQANPPIPHPTRFYHNPSTQKRAAEGGQRWQYGRQGQSAASVRSDEWGTHSEKNRTELGQPRQRKHLVCGGTIVSRALLSRWPHAATGRRRRPIPPDSPSSSHPPPDCTKLPMAKIRSQPPVQPPNIPPVPPPTHTRRQPTTNQYNVTHNVGRPPTTNTP